MGQEAEIEKWACHYAQKKGVWVRKFSSPGRAHVPDRVLIHDGVPLFIEFKAPQKKPSLAQNIEIGIIRSHGACATWADSRESAAELIDTLRKGDIELLEKICDQRNKL